MFYVSKNVDLILRCLVVYLGQMYEFCHFIVMMASLYFVLCCFTHFVFVRLWLLKQLDEELQALQHSQLWLGEKGEQLAHRDSELAGEAQRDVALVQSTWERIRGIIVEEWVYYYSIQVVDCTLSSHWNSVLDRWMVCQIELDMDDLWEGEAGLGQCVDGLMFWLAVTVVMFKCNLNVVCCVCAVWWIRGWISK